MSGAGAPAVDLFLTLDGAVPSVRAVLRPRAHSVSLLTPEEADAWTNEQLTDILLVQGLTLKEAAKDVGLQPLLANLKAAIEATNEAINDYYEEIGWSLRAYLASAPPTHTEMCLVDATANPIELLAKPAEGRREHVAYVRLHTLGISKKLLRHYEESVASEATYTYVLGRHPLMNAERLALEEIRAAADELPVLMDELEDLHDIVGELRLKVAPLRDVVRCILQLRDFLEYRKTTLRRRHHLLGVFH